MVTVIADNPAVASCIDKILELTRGAGAEFAPGLVLRVADGNMRAEAGTADGKLLVRMPEACLIPQADFPVQGWRATRCWPRRRTAFRRCARS